MVQRIREIIVNQTRFRITGHESVAMLDRLEEKKWEPETFKIFDRFIQQDRVYVDIGAFIGSTVLYAAHKARHSYAVEPNPLSYASLIQNVELNPSLRDKITCFHGCIGERKGIVRLHAPHGPYISTATTLSGDSVHSWLVPAVTFEQFIDLFGITEIGFIKMDIEGGECSVVPQMHQYLHAYKPTLFLSMHYWSFPHPSHDLAGILEALNAYKFIYTRDGNIADRNELRSGKNMGDRFAMNTDLLATDDEWMI